MAKKKRRWQSRSVLECGSLLPFWLVMKLALAIIAAVFALGLYSAWLNGLFLRCPYCRKIGSWRFDAAEPVVETKDEDGVVESSRQVRVCRKCGKRVLDTWSDHAGRSFEKLAE